LKRAAKWIAALSLAAGGCGGSESPDDKGPVAMGKIPAAVVKAAQKRMPEVSFDGATKEKVGKVHVYALKGKDKAGQAREVEVSADGKVMGVK